MVQGSKDSAWVIGLRASLIPPETRAQLSEAAIAARLAYVADLSNRAATCGNTVLAGCYNQVAKAALTALPEAEVIRKAREYRAKARMLGNCSSADSLRRYADELEASNPQPPRADVRKAAGGQPTLIPLYDRNGLIFGVAEAADIIPVVSPDTIAKATSAGHLAVHDGTGKLTGFVHPDAVTPVTTGITGMGKPRQTGPPAAAPADGPQQSLPGDVPGRQVVKQVPRAAAARTPVAKAATAPTPAGPPTPAQVIKGLGPGWMPVCDWTGRLAGAVLRSNVTPLAAGQVLKGAASSSRANVYDAQRRRVGTAALAKIVPLDALTGGARAGR